MADARNTGGMGDIAFLEAYHQSVLRKPQVVADALLRATVTSGQDDRLLVMAGLAFELAEACRRLVVVRAALADRWLPVADAVGAELPGVEAWRTFATWAGSTTPEAMLRELALGEDARESAERLRSQPDLGWVTPLIAGAETGDLPIVLRDRDRGPDATVVVGRANGEGGPAISLGEGDAATLADMTADMVSIARGFLGSYLAARREAGRTNRDG